MTSPRTPVRAPAATSTRAATAVPGNGRNVNASTLTVTVDDVSKTPASLVHAPGEMYPTTTNLWGSTVRYDSSVTVSADRRCSLLIDQIAAFTAGTMLSGSPDVFITSVAPMFSSCANGM